MAFAISLATALLTLAGLAFMVIALWSIRDFVRSNRRRSTTAFAPDVTILKPVKGVDAEMYTALISHCRQQYPGRFELLFGVSSMDDPAVAEIERLRTEFPEVSVRLVECPQRIGTSGKVSNLVQMLPHASYEHVLINDGDILVSQQYLERVMPSFADAKVGLVTCAYRGRTAEKGATIWAKLEALGLSTDFLPGLLTARKLEKGIHFGLGATLATTKTIIREIGGLEPIAEYLADDYELGMRIHRAGYRVELSDEVVETSVPQYTAGGYWSHQLRWWRTVRDARRGGYFGMPVTYCVPWAMAACLASGFDLWGFSLLSLALLARMAVALAGGVGVLRDEQVLRDLWLIPVKDLVCLGLWLWGLADDTIEWRGEKFRLDRGKLIRV